MIAQAALLLEMLDNSVPTTTNITINAVLLANFELETKSTIISEASDSVMIKPRAISLDKV